jgi:hypothetical protein
VRHDLPAHRGNDPNDTSYDKLRSQLENLETVCMMYCTLDLRHGAAKEAGHESRRRVFRRGTRMHWVWTNERTEDGQAACNTAPAALDELDELSFQEGRPVTVPVPPITLEMDENSQGKLPDNLISSGARGLVFNSKLRETLAAIGVDNLQYFPVQIVNPIENSSSDDYQICNIIGRIAAMDMAASKYTTFTLLPEMLQFIQKLVLLPAKLAGHDLFRLHELQQIIIASDRVKRACEANKISGVRFYAPEEYTF